MLDCKLLTRMPFSKIAGRPALLIDSYAGTGERKLDGAGDDETKSETEGW